VSEASASSPGAEHQIGDTPLAALRVLSSGDERTKATFGNGWESPTSVPT